MTAGAGSLAACTVGEGDYHYGTGAVANSLHASGFRGCLYIGYRGDLPHWAHGQDVLALPEGMSVTFVRLDESLNPNFQKAGFMLEILEGHPEHRGVGYFDSDVVVTASWDFFEQWSEYGVGLCMDMVPFVPERHPWRLAWRQLADGLGMETRPLDFYCNAGFVLVPREHSEFLELWRRAVTGVLAHIAESGESHVHTFGDVASPFHRTDQDALAIATMATGAPLSVVGSDGMGFTSGVNLMAHAVNQPKPWQRHYLRDAVIGKPPVLAHREYWKHVTAPIPLFEGRTSPARHLRLATVVSSVFRRPRFWAAD